MHFSFRPGTKVHVRRERRHTENAIHFKPAALIFAKQEDVDNSNKKARETRARALEMQLEKELKNLSDW